MEEFEIKEGIQESACSGQNYRQRRDRLRPLLKQRNLDSLLVTHPANRFYLSGFELHDSQFNESSGALVIGSDGTDWLATDSRYELAAKELWAEDKIYIYKSISPGIAPLLARAGSLIGFDSASVSLDFLQKLATGFNGSFRPRLLPCNGLVESLRLVKEACELAALDKSFRLNQALMAMLEKEIEENQIAGLTEESLAWKIERYFRENGASGLAFASITASGQRAALPHASPLDEPIQENAPLLVDVGCRMANYCSDQTRTWWLGKEPSPAFTAAKQLVLEAQQAAFEKIRPGASCAEVYKAARTVFEKAGVADNFTHGLGHGVGLETHEGPSLNPRSTQRLEKGMVVTVEPGLYYPEWGGVRHENTVVVTETGYSILGS